MKRYDTYRNSGIEWIGNIPSHWELKKLKHLAKILNGQDHKGVWDENGNYPIIGSGGTFAKANKYLHTGPSVIIGRKGTIDKPQYLGIPFWVVDTAYFTEIYSHTNPKFFFYCCKTIQFDLYKYGSAVPSMTQETLNQIKFAVPSLTEQITIANYLDEKTTQIDNIISKKQQLIDLLKEERITIISKAVSGEGKNWERKKLKYAVSKVGSGITPTGGASVYQQEGIPLLRSQNIYSDGLRLDDVAYISEEIDEQMSNSRIQEGDILLNITGASIGRCFYVTKEQSRGNVNQHVCIIRPIQTQIKTEYLHLFLISDVGQTLIDVCQNGANREGLNFQQIKSFQISLPKIKEQEKIIRNIQDQTLHIDNTTSKIEKEIILIHEYKIALVSEVVTGKIKVA